MNASTFRFLFACALTLSGATSAQNAYQWESYDKRVTSAQSITALGNDLFGDNISLQTGALSFTVTDVDLPGNSGLPVRFTRSYTVANSRGELTNHMLADWTVQVPRLTARFAAETSGTTEWRSGGNSLNRCSNQTAPDVPASLIGVYTQSSFWEGIHLDIPGVASGELLVSAAGIAKPSDGEIWRWTTDGQIQVRCLTSIANGTGEGFIAITPDGTEYRFDRMARRSVPGLYEHRIDSGGASTPYSMTINEHTLYASMVTDRFGNSVEYIYSNAANEPARLTTIKGWLPGTVAEGRQIDITYGTNGKIQTVGDGTHTWTYGYGVDNSPTGRTILSSVAQPDGRSWIISFAGLSHSPVVYDYTGQEPRDCLTAAFPQNYDSEPTGTITHPSGAMGTFRVGLVVHSRSNVVVNCGNITGPTNNTLDDDALFVQEFYAWSLLSKTISGPGIETNFDSDPDPEPMTWTYSYESDLIPRLLSGTTYIFPVCQQGGQCYVPQCVSDSCAGTARTLVTAPDGSHEKYTFGNSWQYNEGKLLKVERQNGAGVTLETETNRYDLTRVDTPTYPKRYGTSLRINVDGFDSEFHRPKIETVTNRDGIDFKWTVDTCSGFPCMDNFARPNKVTRSSTLPFSKQETYSYFDQSTEWVLGQLATTHVDTTLVAQATYYANTALMSTFSAFGQLQQSLTYHGDGNVQTVTDALLRTTTLSSWKRGIPQTITYHDGTSASATVNDFGWITSTTNEMATGYTTSYGHDVMGRVDSITHPGADTVGWSATSIAYDKVTSAEFGIPANHWRRRETTDTRITETYFDALWRPILERRRTTDASAGERFVRKRFDHEGRPIFASYPVASVTNYTTLNTGTTTSYDVLGRVTGTQSQSELGDLTTSTLYLSQFQTQYIDARNNVTTTTYQAFDTPSYGAPLQTTGPEGVTTAYTRDVFGKPLTLTRSGTWFNPTTNANELASGLRRFVYDGQHRLCKTIEPDAGITVTSYDGASNVLWRALGQNTLTSTTDCQLGSVPVGSRSQHGYDARGRLLYIDHPAGTDDVGYTYFADGAMQTASTGTLTASPPTWNSIKTAWTYAYNKRRLLESESLAVDSKTLLLDWSYNARGDVSGLIYPSTHSVGFDPNAYGEPRQVRNLPSGTFYASSATYNPFGGIAGFTYGSAATRVITPNLRGLPAQILDMKSGTRKLDHQLSYDANANLGGIIDGRDSMESRTLAYDGRDRLTSITGTPGSIGNESFTYDTLDNVRRAVSGAIDRRFLYNASTLRLSQITTVNSPNVMDYAWNDRGELTSRTHTEPGSPPIGPDVIFLNGFEEATISSTETFAFDQAHRLVTTFGQMTHTYDAHNHRVSTATVMTGTRYQVYSRSGELLYVEDSGSNQRTEFFHLGGTLIAERTRPLTTESPVVSYLHSDHRGTPTIKTDSNSVEHYRSRLMPYGAPYDGNWREGPGFTKHATDEVAQLSYMQQRYYDPVSMRFLSPDPVAAGPDSFNVYAYANNNPYTFVDPDGRFSDCPTGTRICGRGIITSMRDGWNWLNGSRGADAANACFPHGCSQEQMRAIEKSGRLRDKANELIGALGSAAPSGRTASAGRAVDAVVEAGEEVVSRTVQLSQGRYPQSAQHILDAIASGKPSTLTIERTNAALRRRESLRGVSTRSGYDRDEFPPAMFLEGGQGASVRLINPSDNRGAGACIGAQCRDLPNYARILIEIIQ